MTLHMKKSAIGYVLLLVPFILGLTAEAREKFPAYHADHKVEGKVSVTGSETMKALLKLWAREFSQWQPRVSIQVSGGGSNKAISAFEAGRVDLIASSRKLSDTEMQEYFSYQDYYPTELVVAIDAIAIYLNKGNPLKNLTLQQLARIFQEGGVTTWGELGLSDSQWVASPIHIYGRDESSGTQTFLIEHLLKGGKLRQEYRIEPGPASVAWSVSNDQFGIGYSGLGPWATGSRVHLASLASDDQNVPVLPVETTVNDGSYPLSRALYLYVNLPAALPHPPAHLMEFLKYILSENAQVHVEQSGLIPVSLIQLNENRKKLGIK